MRRRLFTLLALLSLLLFVATAVIWVRSHSAGHQLLWQKTEDTGHSHYRWYFVIEWRDGGLQIAQDAEVHERSASTVHEAALSSRRWVWRGHSALPVRYPTPAFRTGGRTRAGFWFTWQHKPWVVRRELIVPFWFIAAVTSVLPLVWVRRFNRSNRRRKRRALGLCLECGYDLRASGATCPECGATTPSPAPAAA